MDTDFFMTNNFVLALASVLVFTVFSYAGLVEGLIELVKVLGALVCFVSVIAFLAGARGNQ